MSKFPLHLPQSELDIMLVLWEQEGPVTSLRVLEALRPQHPWGITTVLNFLSRLSERGFVSVEKRGRTNYYLPLIPREDYLREANRDFLTRLHGGSLVQLILSLYETGVITDEDLLQLRRHLDGQQRQRSDIPHWLL